VEKIMHFQSTSLELPHSLSDEQEARQLLKHSEERFRTLVENIPGAVYRCTYNEQLHELPPRTMVFLSEAIQNVSGYPPSDFINNRVRSFTSIIHPQDRAWVEQAIRQNINAKQPYVIEYRILRANGSIVWVYDKGQGILDDKKEIVWLDGVILDITERKQAEADLHYTQAFLSSVVENLPMAVFIKDANELRVKYWNKASEELFGYSREEVLGKNDYDLLPKEQAGYICAKDRQVLTGGQLIDIPEAPLVTPHRGKRLIHTKKVPLLDETGTPQYLLAICEDITERKQAEEVLRESEAHYRRIVETATEGVWMFDADSKTIFANSRLAEMLGYTVEEMLGRALFDFIDEESRAQAQAYVERRRLGIQERHDFKFRCKDGSDLWALVSATPIFDAEGQFVGVLRMITDISERKRTEEALRLSESQLRAKNQQLKQTLRQLKQTQAQLIQNEKMVSLGQMVAGIAHEINNPVSFIYGNVAYAHQYTAELLNLIQLYAKHHPEPAPELQNEIEALDLNFIAADFPKLLDSMKEGANRIRQIVQSLRNFSRLDEAEIKPVNLHEGLDNTLLILQHRLKRHAGKPGIEVRKEYGQLPLVECYAGSLNQVFMNLLSNAIDALEPQPEPRVITIRTEVGTRNKGRLGESDPITQTPTPFSSHSRSSYPQFVVIRIADNGPGIPLKVKKKIFDPFFTTKPVGVGTGLGLAIAHSIVVEKHGGTLTCNSTPGKGAEFVIELPLR
jgi:PAS domain S-box-containing protein